MTESEAIQARHSVRQYKAKAIEGDIAKQIEDKVAEVNAESGLHFQFLNDSGTAYTNLFLKITGLNSAPASIACVGKDSADLEEKVGYYGEKIVLFLQTIGLNTCWVGSFNKKRSEAEIGEGERNVISIAVGYGENEGKAHKSKSVDQLVEAKADSPEWFNEGVKAALLAPTALNQQKFVIRLKDDDTAEIVSKGGAFTSVDLGIVKYHFEVGSGRKL